MFKKTKLENGYYRIETEAHNHINDRMIFYEQDGNYYDNGEMAFELDCVGMSEEDILKELKIVASWFFLELDEKEREFSISGKTEIESITALIQAYTALSQVARDFTNKRNYTE